MAFTHCESLWSVNIPEGVTEIGDFTFGFCYGLRCVTLPPSVTKVGDNAFALTKNLLKAAYPNTLQKVFTDWAKNFIYDIYDPKKDVYEKGCIYKDGMTNLAYVPMELEGKFVVPESVTKIDDYAFAYCNRLESVILPGKLETIGKGAFKWSSSPKDIIIPKGVTSIGYDAFAEAGFIKGAYPNNLSNPFKGDVAAIAYDEYDSMIEDGFVYSRRKDVLYYVPLSVSSTFEVPEGVTEITERAFAKCVNLETVILPAGLTKLGDGVWSECNAIKSVTCMGTEPISANQDLFTNTVYDEATLYVPKGCEAAYVKVVPWRYFTNIVEHDLSGVENVAADNMTAEQNLPCEVYTLDGVKVADSAANLPAGLYIVRQGNSVKKIAVK